MLGQSSSVADSAKKLTYMYQITYVLFMHSLMFYDVTSDDVVVS